MSKRKEIKSRDIKYVEVTKGFIFKKFIIVTKKNERIQISRADFKALRQFLVKEVK